MTATATVRDALAAAYVGLATHVQLFTADPGLTGANEFAHARQPLTWNDTGTGVYVSDEVTFDIPGDTSFTHVGVFDDDIAGNFLDSGVNVISFGSVAVYTFTISYTQL